MATNDKRIRREQVGRILDGLADSIESTPAEELLDEAQIDGLDPAAIAARLKSAGLAAVKDFEQRKLHLARQRHRTSVAALERRVKRVAVSPEQRRVQLGALLERNPKLRSSITMQHRDLKEMTDEDVCSALEELDALGALDEMPDV